MLSLTFRMMHGSQMFGDCQSLQGFEDKTGNPPCTPPILPEGTRRTTPQRGFQANQGHSKQAAPFRAVFARTFAATRLQG
jgi:hypothetical protein